MADFVWGKYSGQQLGGGPPSNPSTEFLCSTFITTSLEGDFNLEAFDDCGTSAGAGDAETDPWSDWEAVDVCNRGIPGCTNPNLTIVLGCSGCPTAGDCGAVVNDTPDRGYYQPCGAVVDTYTSPDAELMSCCYGGQGAGEEPEVLQVDNTGTQYFTAVVVCLGQACGGFYDGRPSPPLMERDPKELSEGDRRDRIDSAVADFKKKAKRHAEFWENQME